MRPLWDQGPSLIETSRTTHKPGSGTDGGGSELVKKEKNRKPCLEPGLLIVAEEIPCDPVVHHHP